MEHHFKHYWHVFHSRFMTSSLVVRCPLLSLIVHQINYLNKKLKYCCTFLIQNWQPGGTPRTPSSCTTLRTHTHKHTHTHTHTHTYIHTHIHTYIHTYTHTYIHTYIHSYIHTYIHTHTHTYIPHTYIHTHTHTYIHMYAHACEVISILEDFSFVSCFVLVLMLYINKRKAYFFLPV